MKAWAKTLGTLAGLGTGAPLALAAALYALDGTGDPSEGTATEQHGLAGQHLAFGEGLTLGRVVSSTRSSKPAGPMIVPAASGQLTLAAFEGTRLLEPANIVVFESGAPRAPVLLAAVDDGTPGNSGFAIFRSNAAGSSRAAAAARAGARSLGALTSGAGTISGPSGGGSAFQPDTLHLLQASGSLGNDGSGTGGLPGFGGDGVTLQVAPLPPAILAFLSGLAALFAFRRMRGTPGEPATR